MSEIDKLREEAARARRLAAGVGDASLARFFKELAEEYEALLKFLEPSPRQVEADIPN